VHWWGVGPKTENTMQFWNINTTPGQISKAIYKIFTVCGQLHAGLSVKIWKEDSFTGLQSYMGLELEWVCFHQIFSAP